MAIKLLRQVYIAGDLMPPGVIYSASAAVEGDLVHRGLAEWYNDGPLVNTFHEASGGAKVWIVSRLRGEEDGLDLIVTAPKAEAYPIQADGQIVAGPCVVYGFVATGGVSPSVALYNGTSSGGQLLHPARTETIGQHVVFPAAIYCAEGLYADLGGTSPTFTVFALE